MCSYNDSHVMVKESQTCKATVPLTIKQASFIVIYHTFSQKQYRNATCLFCKYFFLFEPAKSVAASFSEWKTEQWGKNLSV